MNNELFFPFFINIKNKKIYVFGAGKIAFRRVNTLLDFTDKIKVISAEFDDNFYKINKNVSLIKKNYEYGDCEGAEIVIAATNDKNVNKNIYEECKNKNIFVNTVDCKQRCDFYFPSVINYDDFTIGITSSGKNHKKLKKFADYIRKIINYNN